MLATFDLLSKFLMVSILTYVNRDDQFILFSWRITSFTLSVGLLVIYELIFIHMGQYFYPLVRVVSIISPLVLFSIDLDVDVNYGE